MSSKPTRRQLGKVTIHDVASRVGVSAMTVSRVLNDDKNVRSTTRARIREVMTELGFSPNPAARSLASADLIRVGLMYGNSSSAYFSELLIGVFSYVSRSHTQIIVEMNDAEENGTDAVRRLIDGGIDGVILLPALCNDRATLDAFAAAGVMVAAFTNRRFEGVIGTRIDDRAAARAMTEYLIDLGHRRIGFIEGHPDHDASTERRLGYFDALSAAGLCADGDMVRPGRFTYRSGLAAAETLLGAPRPPTAIFASNDDMAAAAISVAHRQSIGVPSELSVCGFDNTAIATAIWPELTTVRQPIALMASALVESLVHAVRHRRLGQAVELSSLDFNHELVVRGSSAARLSTGRPCSAPVDDHEARSVMPLSRPRASRRGPG